jgi:GntR family transcriptional regulator/MocR family aminotransferase
VNRNTVVAAYRELVAEGWAVARPGGGTFVAEGMPEPRQRSFARLRPSSVAKSPSFPLRGDPPPPLPPPPHEAPALFAMPGGVPDVRLVPGVLLARALRHVLTSRDAGDALRYGDPRGDPRLRTAVANLVRESRGIPARPDEVIIVGGSQMALALIGRAVVPLGSAVAVEAIGYRPAWAAFAQGGARVVPVALDAQGLDVDALETLANREPIGAVYLTPHHQYPTTITLTPGRRIALLALARRMRFAIIEDDYDTELHYEGRPVLPLASADVHGSVVYVGTLSKVLAPGLRLGYVVASAPLVERLAADRFVLDRQGDHVMQRAAAELIEDGTVARHVRRVRRIYEGRRDFLISELERALEGRVTVKRPPGGLAVWARIRLAAPEVAVWERRALELGVSFAAGERFTWSGRPIPFARFGFGPLDEGEAREAVRRLARAFPR